MLTSMDLGSELTNFIAQLRATSAVCMRPKENGDKCAQCQERLSIAYDLEWMLKKHYEAKKIAHAN